LADYDPQAFGETHTVYVDIPATGDSNGFLYINIHLDYGLKDTTYWSKGGLNEAISNGLTSPYPYPTIYDFTPYTFSDGEGTVTTSQASTPSEDPVSVVCYP
jgi:hypothetical protein